MIVLWGTVTSPFVRKVRIHALEAGIGMEFKETASEAGQAALRKVSPLWKIPVLQSHGDTLLDSRIILRWLWETHESALRGAGMRGLGDQLGRFEEENLITLVDGALDAAINRFYLLKDGLPDVGYVTKQGERTRAALTHVASQLRGPSFSGDGRLGLAEVALLCTLEWLTFRQQWAWQDVPSLVAFHAAHKDRPSMVASRPS